MLKSFQSENMFWTLSFDEEQPAYAPQFANPQDFWQPFDIRKDQHQCLRRLLEEEDSSSDGGKAK